MLFRSALAQHAAIALENAKLYEQIRERTLEQERNKRLASMGQMAAGIAHEIRNPLGIINTASYYLQATETQQDEEREEQFSIIQLEIKRANRFIDDLLQFSRPRELKKKPVVLNTLLEELQELLSREGLFSRIQWQIRLEKDLQPLAGDYEQLRQVFSNTLFNAAQAMEGQGTITLRSRKVTKGIVVTIQDSGPGIPAEVLPKIFDPFFTTKSAKKGTGLGLAISHGIIEKHHGTLSARSPKGSGAVFRIFLPNDEPVSP